MFPILGKLIRRKRTPIKDAADIRWISDLPRDNPLAAVDTVIQKLAAIVTIDMPLESWRLKALLLIDARCRHHVLALEQQYISVQKLRPELDDKMWDSIYAWCRYLARGYHAFITDHVAHPDHSGFQHSYLPLIVARAMHHQANIARWRYMRYLGMPEGGWLLLHRLYTLSEREGFAMRMLKFYDDQPEVSVGERYVEALMLDTLNRTNMTKLQIEMVNGWLGNWLKAISISRTYDEQRFLFFTDVQEDRAGRRIRNFKPTPGCLYWDTDPMMLKIQHIRKGLEQGKSAADMRLDCTCKPAECIQLLGQLLTEWSRTDYQRQRRSEDRKAVMSTAIVANGLTNAWQQIKDVSQSANQRNGSYVAIDDRSFEERLAAHSIPIASRGPVIAFAGAAGERWMISDESASGFGAFVGADIASWAKLGRLVTLVTEDNRSQVALGVIRSIKQQSNGQRHIGIEVITRQASAVHLTDRMPQPISRPSGDLFIDATLINPGVITLHGLLIPADKKRGLAISLMLPRAEFNPSSIYEISRNKDSRLIRPGNILEQNDDWVRILIGKTGEN